MFSALFLGIALADLALLAWAIRLYRAHRGPTLVMVLTNLVFLWADAAIIGSGRWIGEGDLLLALSHLRFGVHHLVLPLMIIAAGSIARLAGLGWAQKKSVMAAFCLVAVTFIALDLPDMLQSNYFPACFADTLRYVQAVAPAEVCRIGQGMGARPGLPVAAIVSVVVMLAVGIAIGVRRRWWWLAVGSFVMFLLAALPASKVGPWPSSIGEVIFFAAVLATISHLHRLRLAAVQQR
jgi:hypothetical protein